VCLFCIHVVFSLCTSSTTCIIKYKKIKTANVIYKLYNALSAYRVIHIEGQRRYIYKLC